MGAVNPRIALQVQVSLGSATDDAGRRVPRYAPAVTVMGQVQPIGWRDLQQLDAVNQQGTKEKVYLNGQVDGIVRPDNKGGDLITDPATRRVWLVVQVLEGWTTAGWCSLAVVLQNGR